ncbi:MAG: hypothetical protein ACRDSF_22970 [Pseudonocardiaceae bacterium]
MSVAHTTVTPQVSTTAPVGPCGEDDCGQAARAMSGGGPATIDATETKGL